LGDFLTVRRRRRLLRISETGDGRRRRDCRDGPYDPIGLVPIRQIASVTRPEIFCTRRQVLDPGARKADNEVGDRLEGCAGNHGDFWIGSGSWAQIYHQRVQTSLEQATGGGLRQFRPQRTAVAQHPVCKPSQMGKRSRCGTSESQWQENGGRELIAE
jgi:hypothetical protein